jgi:hypothetical protein
MSQAAFDEFYKWAGVSVTQWAYVEDYLFMTCHKCLRTPRYDLASIVYYRFPGIDSRLQLVDELLKANLPERKPKMGGHEHADVRRWSVIHGEIRNLLKTRRRIAHHPMRARMDFESEGFRLHIETSFAEELRGRGKRLPPITKTDLTQHVRQLQAAIEKLKHFYEETLPKHVG